MRLRSDYTTIYLLSHIASRRIFAPEVCPSVDDAFCSISVLKGINKLNASFFADGTWQISASVRQGRLQDTQDLTSPTSSCCCFNKETKDTAKPSASGRLLVEVGVVSHSEKSTASPPSATALSFLSFPFLPI